MRYRSNRYTGTVLKQNRLEEERGMPRYNHHKLFELITLDRAQQVK